MVELKFTEELDAAAATDPQNYQLSQWTYPWTSQYGTRGKIYSARSAGETQADSVLVGSVKLSDDRKTVTLKIPALMQQLVRSTLGKLPGLPDMIETSMGLVLAIEYNLRSADGLELKQVIHKTIHRVTNQELERSLKTQTKAEKPTVTVKNKPPESKVATKTEARVVEVSSTGIALSYNPTEIRMKAGEHIVIRYKNASDMAHNMVIVKNESDINPVGIAALSAQQDQWIPKSEQERILAASKLAYPGDIVILEFTAPAPGVYPYICTFSGHFTMMQGRITVEP
jgi:plastocyanin